MQQTAKPQVLPRRSLMKKNPQTPNDEKNSLLEIPNSTTKMPATEINHQGKNEKPSIPEKPPIASKPVLNNLNKKSVPNLMNHHSANTNNITINSSTNISPPNTNTSKSLPMVNKSPLTSRKLTKFRINSAELNRLRYRKEFFDDKNVDSKGNFLIYDVREDEEQIQKMNEICELLVAGGYFRARIKGLHNFDKIVGGMCWAIQMCNIDLDVDIFYQENLSIGQKIALTEKIVHVLQKMKCPFKLEPHQIQGMDCIHIYPTIQWLIKKSLETRQQSSDYIREYSTWQFDRIFNKYDEISSSVILQNDNLVDPIKAHLQRRFLHPSRNKLKEESIRVKTTLLEYGVIGSGKDQRVLSSTDSANVNDSSSEPNSENRTTRSDSDPKDLKHLLNSMTKTDETKFENTQVSTSIVGKIIDEQSEEFKCLADDYEKDKTSLSSLDTQFLREEAKLKHQIAIKRKELENIFQNQTTEKLFAIKEKLKILEAKSNEILDSEKNESKELKEEKIRLTELLNVLRKQKSELKQHCREEKQRLEKEIEMIEAQRVNNEQFKDKLKEIDQELKTCEEKYTTVKKELAMINKKYAIIQRKFDDIPNRTELAQYQKRFLELYNQLSIKHNETKKFYTLYNTLSDEKMYLEKEFNLINSILENFQKAYNSNPMIKDEFLAKFQQTLESIIQNKNKVAEKLQSEKTKRDQLNQHYSQLMEEQRLYFIAVKAFKEECKINEELIVKLDINK